MRKSDADLSSPELDDLNARIDDAEKSLAGLHQERRALREKLKSPKRVRGEVRAKDFAFAKQGWPLKTIALVRNVQVGIVKQNIINAAMDLAEQKVGRPCPKSSYDWDAYEAWEAEVVREARTLLDQFPDTSRFSLKISPFSSYD